MALFTPTNQKRLTNVSIVRLKKGGNRYELACYPNKVRAWRDKLETNLDEVLQTYMVFSNVSKGQFANKKEMFQVFRTEDEVQIIKMILEQGELQSTEKERAVEQNSLYRDVAKLVSEKCVNTETNRAYTVTMIEKMMKDCHISLKANKSAKQHALEVIRQLRAVEGFKIAPAMMEVVISIDKDCVLTVKDQLFGLCNTILRQGISETGSYDLAVTLEPENYGAIESLLRSRIKGKFCIDIVGNTRHGAKSSKQSEASKAWNGDVQEHNKTTHVQEIASAVHDLDTTEPPPSVSGTEELLGSEGKSEMATVSSAVSKQPRHQKRRKHGRRKARDDWPDDEN